MRYKFIQDYTNEFPVVKMCKVLRVSKSGYYSWLDRKPSKRMLLNQQLVLNIQQIHRQSKQRYGSPRIAKELQIQGFKVSECLVAKLMKQHEIRSIIRKRFKQTTHSNHSYPVVENVLNRRFLVATNNEAWVSDLTYINTREGWLYLTTVIDLLDRKIIGWALSHTMYAKDTSIAAFKMAVQNCSLEKEKPLIFHSDRGIQYACAEFTEELKKHKSIIRSMSRKGNCWDNAVAESFFKTIKTELIYHHKYETRKQAELAIFEYIETFYNKTRRHNHLQNLTILEHQKLLTNQLNNVA